jgi:hypothetical protein
VCSSDLFNTSSIVPRALERAIQGVAESVEQDAANLSYAFPAVYGTPNLAAFNGTTGANAIAHTRKAMSLNLCPNSDQVAAFLSTTDAWALKVTDDFKKNAQLASLARAESQYGKAVLGEILGATLFENQFISTRQPGNYAGTIKIGSAANVASTTLSFNATQNSTIKKGDAFSIGATGAPEALTYVTAAANANLTANTAGNVTITQGLEYAVAANAVVTALTTDALGYSPYENLFITPDALCMGNRILLCQDIAEATGNAWSVADTDSDENDYSTGTGLVFTLKRFPLSYEGMYEVSIFYGMDYADVRLGGRLLSGGTSI